MARRRTGTDPKNVVGIKMPDATPPLLVDKHESEPLRNDLIMGPVVCGADGRDSEQMAVPVVEDSPTGPRLRLGVAMAEAVMPRPTAGYADVDEPEEVRDPDTDHGKRSAFAYTDRRASEPTMVEVENLDPEQWDESSPIRVHQEEASSPELAAAIATIFGPPGPKETLVSTPVQPLPQPPIPPSPSSAGWTKTAAFVTGLAIILGIASWNGGLSRDLIGLNDPTAIELDREEQELPKEKAGLAPVVEKEANAPTAEAVNASEPPPVVYKPPVVAEPVKPVELPPVVKPAEVVASVVPKAVKEPVATASSSAKSPTSLVVSAMGLKPACVAECTWGDLTDKGFPKTVDSKRTIVCGEDTWLTTKWTKIETGEQVSCFTVTSLEDNPSGP